MFIHKGMKYTGNCFCFLTQDKTSVKHSILNNSEGSLFFKEFHLLGTGWRNKDDFSQQSAQELATEQLMQSGKSGNWS